MTPEQKLKSLSLELPAASAPVANYVNAVRSGARAFACEEEQIAGADGRLPKGKLGREFSVEQGYQHARTVGMDLLAVMRAELGSLDRVKRVVKVLGMVNARAGTPVRR